MSDALTLTWPQDDVDALFRQMEQARRYLNYDTGHALRAAARHLLMAVGTSTRVAPKFRKMEPATWLDEEARGRYERGHLRERKLLAFNITGWFGVPRRPGTKTVFSRDAATAKRRHATIGRSGLAKAAWGAASFMITGKRLVFSGGKFRITTEAARYVSAQAQFKGEDNYVEINNYLTYAEEALIGGKNAVETAMQRAASSMEKSIERQLVKRMGLGSLAR